MVEGFDLFLDLKYSYRDLELYFFLVATLQVIFFFFSFLE